jgi:hypothetical protein
VIASAVAASNSTPPVIAKFNPEANPIRPRPLSITAITKPPITASLNLPRPPNKLTPPTTAAAIALNTIDLPAAASNVIVEFRDEHSKTVKSIHMGALQPGSNKVVWDGTNDKGVKLPNGSYTFNLSMAAVTTSNEEKSTDVESGSNLLVNSIIGILGIGALLLIGLALRSRKRRITSTD